MANAPPLAWLESSRAQREVEYQLALSIELVEANFSYRRVQGLQQLHRYLRSLSDVELDRVRAAQIEVPNSVLFHLWNAIMTPASASEGAPLSPVTDTERQSALHLVTGLLLLDSSNRPLLRNLGGLDTLLTLIRDASASDALRATALETMAAFLSDSAENQRAFLLASGFETVVKLVQSKKVAKTVRWAGAEMLGLLVAYFDHCATDDETIPDYGSLEIGRRLRSELHAHFGLTLSEMLLEMKLDPSIKPHPFKSFVDAFDRR